MRETFWDRMRNIVPSKYDDPDVRLFKIIIYSLLGIVLLMVIAGLTTFLLSLRGSEETMVPDVRNLELMEAMLTLQERGLSAEIEVRYSADPALAGKVIAQSPPSGPLVRAGKQLDLIISRGARIDRLGAYVGRTLTGVTAELRALFATGDQTIEIGTVTYTFDEAEPGTILAQDPPPGADITTITEVDLIVSRGPDVEKIELPTITGLTFSDAAMVLAQNNIPFDLTLRIAEPNEVPGYIVEQDPPPGEEVDVGTFVTLVMTQPESVPEGEVFGVFERALPEYPVVVELSMESVTPTGERELLLSMLHPGTKITVPYLVPENTSLILYREGEEISRTIIRAPAPVEEGDESSEEGEE